MGWLDYQLTLRSNSYSGSEPSVGSLCGDCGFGQDAASVDTRDWFHYDLPPAAMDALGSGLLPYRSLSRVMTQSFGAYSIRDFIAAAGMLRRISQRYKRPLTGFRLTITNADSLREKLGGRGLSAMFNRLGEIISQILRESDLITATNHAVYTLLPETSDENVMVAVTRIEEGMRNNIAEPMAFEVATHTEETIEEMLAELR